MAAKAIAEGDMDRRSRRMAPSRVLFENRRHRETSVCRLFATARTRMGLIGSADPTASTLLIASIETFLFKGS